LLLKRLPSTYKQVSPFSDNFGATSQAVIKDFFSVEELAETSVEDLLNFVIEHGRNRFTQPEEVVKKLKQVARNLSKNENQSIVN
jgi:hypothetical protein